MTDLGATHTPNPWTDFAWPDSVPDSVRRALRQMQEVVAAGEVERAVDRLAVQLSVSTQFQNPVFVVVMQGGMALAGMLLRRLVMPAEFGFVRVARYGAATRGGELTWGAQDVPELRDRTVVFVDDILDEGKTLLALNDWAHEQGARDVVNAVLVMREGLARPEPPDTLAALRCGPGFLVGCGMDLAGYGRNLPAIYRLEDEPAGDPA